MVFIKGQKAWNKGIPMTESLRLNLIRVLTGKKLSEEHRNKVSIANKGKNLGKKHTIEARKRMSESRKGRIFSEETKRKISETHKLRGVGKWMIGRHPSEETLKKLSLIRTGKTVGEKNGNWKGGTTSLYKIIRASKKYKKWRLAVFTRDNWTCQECGKRGGRLDPHHIKSFAHHPELRFELSNGLTLCKPCHRKTDNYGKFIR